MDKRIKAQVSMEIMILMGFLFLIFIIFLGFVNVRLSEKNDESEYTMLSDVSEQIQNEIRIAYNAKDGYSRSFDVPEKLDNRIEYDIQTLPNRLVTNTSKYQHVLTVPDITGAVVKGQNNIRKTNQSIIIN